MEWFTESLVIFIEIQQTRMYRIPNPYNNSLEMISSDVSLISSIDKLLNQS